MQLFYFLTWGFWRGVVREWLKQRRIARWKRLRSKVAKVAILALLLPGCAGMFSAKTKARYLIHPDGTREVFYESAKEQVGLDASVDKNGLLHVKVDKASTQVEAIAAALLLWTETMRELIPLLKAAAPTRSFAEETQENLHLRGSRVKP